MKDLDEVIECLEAQIGLDLTFQKACQFMLAYLSLIKAPLPSVANCGISVAKSFFLGGASGAEVERARVACWEFLDAKNASIDVSTSENCAVRATICCLHTTPPDNDVFDLLCWFLELVKKVEDHSSDVPSLIEKYLVIQMQ